jgi:electron transfer flavoprotein alpha subunit
LDQQTISSKKKNSFSNKAFNTTEITTDVKVISLAKIGFSRTHLSNQEDFAPTLSDGDFAAKVDSVEKSSEK